MNLGWNVCEKIAREYRGDGDDQALSSGNNAAICAAIDFAIAVLEGDELKDTPDGIGAESEQLTAQHIRTRYACGALSALRALSQHFIILPAGE